MSVPIARPVFLLPLLLALPLTGCGKSEAQAAEVEGTRNLLDVEPARTNEIPGRLTPARAGYWGRQRGSGWRDELGDVDGRPAALSKGTFGTVDLPGPSTLDRTIAFDLARAGQTGPIRVSFNGVLLDEIEQVVDLTTHEYVIPASIWTRTSNDLRLEATSGKGLLKLTEVRVTPSEVFDRKAHTLDSGVHLAWDLLLDGGGLVDLSVVAGAQGTLTASIERIAIGASKGAPVTQEVFPLETGQALEIRLPLAVAAGSLQRLALHWEATGADGALEVTRLELFEDESHPLPPILFISVDTLAAPNMSVYGYERETTPHLASFVADSVFFEGARTNAPWTVPSYSSQFTGLYPTASNLPKEMIRELDGDTAMDWYQIPGFRLTLAELLQARGYRTAAFVDNPWLTDIQGLDQGFETFDTEGARHNLQDAEMGMRYVLPKAHDFLATDEARPPFVLAQLFDVHGPYLNHEPYVDLFVDELDPGAYTELPVANTSQTVFGSVPIYVAKKRFEDADDVLVEAELLRNDYDSQIVELDAYLGEFFDELKAAGLYDDLMIVFSADHGEGMEDHDWLFRHGLVYDSASHVPLIVKLPGQASAGTRVTTPVQLVDLMPTLAEIVGYDLGDYGHGRSLMTALEGGDLEPTPVLMTANLMEQKALLEGHWKLIATWPRSGPIEVLLTYQPIQAAVHAKAPQVFENIFGGPPPIASRAVVERVGELKADFKEEHREVLKLINGLEPFLELYDLSVDPREEHDVAADHPERVDAMFATLMEEFARSDSYRHFEDHTSLELSDDKKAELEALGYVAE